MERYTIKNGVKIIYEFRPANITSFCIGFNAGALEENTYNAGTAHALEHMLFKGTKERSEAEINKSIDEVFGFSNAMTNYPYAIYYGTVNSEDFMRGFELYSDILLNPSFPLEGFKEEMNVIKEELRDWREDIVQSTEDYMLFNAFSQRRIKDLIIGREDSLEQISLKELKSFYEEYYTPENCVISIVSNLDKNKVFEYIQGIFKDWNRKFKRIKNLQYEKNTPGIWRSEVKGSTGAKISYLFRIDNLNEREVEVLTLFNIIFGEGVSSILYDSIRTKYGLAYEVNSSIKNERGIKLFTIYLSTSLIHVEKCMNIINSIIEEVKLNEEHYSQDAIDKLFNRVRLKRELAVEKSIELCKKLTTYELMYGRAEKVYEEIKFIGKITTEEINDVVNKIFNEPTVQVVSS
jgi:predicted Zn-dependent peptidase